VSRAQWLAARKDLLASERQLSSLHDSVNADRRRLPMVRIDQDYTFTGPDGQATLPDLFQGSSQLIVQHFMFSPSWDAGCPGCSASCDEISQPLLARLRERDTAFAVISLAPIGKIMKYKAWRGWDFSWYSSFGSDFNYDFHATLDRSIAPVSYDFESPEEIRAAGSADDLIDADVPVEVPGISCFLQDGETVFHTYSAYSHVLENVSAVRGFLELTASGG
jgi:predicted dithiol-disulfide oxidoreductase (DUF899 family)